MSNWVVDYVKLVSPFSEAPIQFNMWAGLSLVSSVLKRHVWINYRTFKVYPNQYIVLVAPPGVGKGEAITPAAEFGDNTKLVNYLSDRITAPRIVEKLFNGFTPPVSMNGAGHVLVGGKDSTATLLSTELPTLLSSSDWMLTFLCDTWDRGKYDYDTRNKGSFAVVDTTVSLLGACVPDYIRKISKNAVDTISSGFSSRTLFVYGKTKSQTLPWGTSFKSDPLAVSKAKALEQRLMTIANMKGEMSLSPEAIKIWNPWYAKLSIPDEEDSDVFKNFKARQDVHVLKVAITLTAAEGGGMSISAATLEKAIKLVDNVAAGLDDIFRGVGESDVSAAIARLQLYIEAKGSTTYREILKDNIRHLNHDDIVKCMNVLEIIHFVTKSVSGSDTLYKWTGQPISKPRQVHKTTLTP